MVRIVLSAVVHHLKKAGLQVGKSTLFYAEEFLSFARL